MKTKTIWSWCLGAACASALVLALAGCYGVVGTGYGYYGEPGYYGPGYFEDYGPEVTIFGGYGRGHFDRDAGHRGFESRGGHGGHGGGGHFGGHH